MKIKYIIFLFTFSLLFLSCGKIKENRISNSKWVFEIKPDECITYWNGFPENRTAFNGSETIEFRGNYDFVINGEIYGTWVLEDDAIIITQVVNKEYNCCGAFGAGTIMVWDILEIKKKQLNVNHAFYKFDNNKYSLSKI